MTIQMTVLPVDNSHKKLPETTSPHLAPTSPQARSISSDDLAPLRPPLGGRGEVGGLRA